MSLIAKAQALQHKRMEALRRYMADIEDIDRRRHELELASSRAWMKVTSAGWATTDLTHLGLIAPKKTRTKRSTSPDPAEPNPRQAPDDAPDDQDTSDG